MTYTFDELISEFGYPSFCFPETDAGYMDELDYIQDYINRWSKKGVYITPLENHTLFIVND